MKQVLLVSFVLTLAGCGFHLRSYELAAGDSAIFLQSSTPARVRGALEQALRTAGVAPAARAADADVVVRLIDGRRERRGVSVDQSALAAEYELSIELQYALADGSGVELLAPQQLRVQRVFRVDTQNLVGNSDEQALVERELEADLVQQVLRAVSAAVERLTSEADAAQAG